MRSSRFSTGGRTTALLALLALIVVLPGSAGGFDADPDGGGERCVGCAGCENGECGREAENSLTSHHHCCTTCCMSHASLALPSALSSPAPVIAEPILAYAPVALAGRSQEAPYRPPRA